LIFRGCCDILLLSYMNKRVEKNWYYKQKPTPKRSSFSLKKVAPKIGSKTKKQRKKDKKGSKKGPRWKKALKITGYVFLGLAVFILAVFLWFAKDLPSSEEILSGRLVAQATQIYDRSGEHLLYEIHGDEKRTIVPIKDLPEYIAQATIAIEDDAFYKHPGFDVKGITRAAWRNLIGQKGYSEGGSTITQQLIKNTILTSEKTYSRKLKELVLSVELEMKLSKDEILDLYLNAIPYGSTAYGIEAASQTFFDKPAKNLSLAEAALLAGLPQAPTYYSPTLRPERAKDRQLVVLKRMEDLGYITSEEAESAAAEELNIVFKRANIKAPHFVDYVKEVLVETYGIKKVETGGLKVITTLDYNKQVIAEEAIANNRKKNLGVGAHNSALVSLDSKNGQILAMVGSVDYFDQGEEKQLDGQVNVITSLRSPGSSIKPLVYVTAFSRGYPPTTILYDLMTSFGDDGSGRSYTPQNYTGGFNGPVSIRTALQQSLNIPAIKAYYLAGADNVSTMAAKFSFSNWVAGKEYGLATAIGGREVYPLEHAGMFQIFANRGIRQKPMGILQVSEHSGEILESFHEEGERVLEENLADTMNNVLSDNNARSWGRRELVLKDRVVATKTGTSNKDLRDGTIRPDNLWTCGYTPQITTTVWVGNNDGSVMSGSATGLNNASPIWQEYMNNAHAGLPVESFVDPKPIEAKKSILLGKTAEEVEVEICLPSGLLANEYCPASMREKRKFRDVHCILYYVNRLDPNGPPLRNPAEDPQFNSWEGAVRGWADKEGFGSEPPKDTDTMHNPEFWPSVSITSPSSGATITSGLFEVSVNVSGTHRIKEVVYYLGGNKVAASSSSPFGAKVVLPAGIDNGFHNLKAVVFDEIDNKAETNIDINLKVSNVKPTVSMATPNSGSSVKLGDSIIVSASAKGTPEISRVEFFAQVANGSVTSLGGDSSADKNGRYGLSWKPPATGTFYLFAKASDTNGNVAESGKVTISVNQ
jgi:1A family penicillin-binding protein